MFVVYRPEMIISVMNTGRDLPQSLMGVSTVFFFATECVKSNLLAGTTTDICQCGAFDFSWGGWGVFKTKRDFVHVFKL